MEHRPTTIGEAVQQLLDRLGLSRRNAAGDLGEAWAGIAGEETARRTSVTGLRRGVLAIEVQSAPLLHELRSFRAEELLRRMQERCPSAAIRAIRFEVGGRRDDDPDRG